MLLSGCGGLTRRHGAAWRRCRAQHRAAPVKKVSRECSKRRAKCGRQSPGRAICPLGLRRLAESTFKEPWPPSGGARATILLTTAASLLLAVLFVVAVPHRYTAVTQIFIDPTDLRAVGNDLTQANQANDAAVLQVESQVRVLTSDNVLRRVVAAESLDRDPEFVSSASWSGTVPQRQLPCRPERAASGALRSSAPSAPTWWT